MLAANPGLNTPRVADALITSLTDRDESVRLGAVEVLGDMIRINSAVASPQIIEAFLGRLNDPNPKVRDSAMGFLGEVYGRQALQSVSAETALFAKLTNASNVQIDKWLRERYS